MRLDKISWRKAKGSRLKENGTSPVNVCLVPCAMSHEPPEAYAAVTKDGDNPPEADRWVF